MDRAKFILLLQALAATKRVEVTEALIMGYWLGCEGLTDQAFEQAVRRALRADGPMPSAGELRKLAGEAQADTSATLAWATVLRAIGLHGAYRSVDFGPLVNATIRAMGGWVELCSRDSDDLREWGRKDFERTYLRLATTSVGSEMAQHLSGITERQNKALGVAAKPVRLLDAATTTALTRKEHACD